MTALQVSKHGDSKFLVSKHDDEVENGIDLDPDSDPPMVSYWIAFV